MKASPRLGPTRAFLDIVAPCSRVFGARVEAYYRGAGWHVEEPLAGEFDVPRGMSVLVLVRGERVRAVLVSEDAPGAIAIAEFGHACRSKGMRGIVASPGDDAVESLCENAGLDHVEAHTLMVQEPPVLASRPHTPAQPSAPPPAEVPMNVSRTDRWASPAVRWGIVALIWVAAIAVSVYDLVRWLS